MHDNALSDVRNKASTFRRYLQRTKDFKCHTVHLHVNYCPVICAEQDIDVSDYLLPTWGLQMSHSPLTCKLLPCEMCGTRYRRFGRSTTDVRVSNVTHFTYMWTTALWDVRNKVSTFRTYLLPTWGFQMSHSSLTCTLLLCIMCVSKVWTFRRNLMPLWEPQIPCSSVTHTCRKSNDRWQKS
jgi:hypothetical protein